jgi:hypothetical protein
MKYHIGQKVKTKMNPHPNENTYFHHWWKITTIAEDHMVLTDVNGNIMVTDENGNGLCPKQGHYIYKTK